MASFFGITSAKYQYAIDEYYRIKKEVCTPPPYFFFLMMVIAVIFSHGTNDPVPSRGKRRRRRTGCPRRPSDPVIRWRTKMRSLRPQRCSVWQRLALTAATRFRARARLHPASSPCRPSSQQLRPGTTVPSRRLSNSGALPSCRGEVGGAGGLAGVSDDDASALQEATQVDSI